MKKCQTTPFCNSPHLIIKQMITTLIMWQLIFTPSVFAGDISEDANLQAQKDACTGVSVEWNDALNSCTIKAEAEQAKTNSEDCSQSEDPDTCYLSSAEDLSSVQAGQDYQDKKGLEMTGKTIAMVYLSFGLIAGAGGLDKVSGGGLTEHINTQANKSKGWQPKCRSGKIFQWTSVAWVAGDLFLKHSAKKGFEKIAEDYKKEEANDELKGTKEGSYQAQVRAFEYLKKEQEDIKKQASRRKLLQLAVVAGYVAAMGFGIAEQMPTSPLPQCIKPPKPEPAAKPGSIFSKARNLIGTSLGNAIASGLMLGLNAYLIYYAINEQKKAKDNIKSINTVLSTYNGYMSGFCPDGREDAAKPDCYCYNSDGTQNPNRTKSVICQNLFATRGVNYAEQTAKAATTGPRQGCVTVTGQFDLNCKCAKMTNTQTGQNACAKVSSLSTNNNGFTSALSVPDAINTANGLTNGASTALANMNAASLTSKAAKNMKLMSQLLSSGKKNGLNLPTKAQLNHTIANDLKTMSTNMKNPGNLALQTGIGGQRNGLPSSVKKALVAAKKNNKSSAAAGALLSSLTQGKGKIDFGKSKANHFVWNDSASGAGGKVKTFMNKKYKYKNADIVNRKDVSLWNVISRRYQTSGIRRLFEDDGE